MTDKDKAALRSQVRDMLAITPERTAFTKAELISSKEQEGMVCEDWRFVSADGQTVPGWFVYPQGQRKPAPAMLYCHAHGAKYHIGRKEIFDGRPSLQGPYGRFLTDMGFSALCLEMPCFGTRSEPKEDSLAKDCMWHGRPLYGQMICELMAGIGFLCDHELVDDKRIGTVGISMGGTHSFWLAALDERLRVAISIACFADLDCLIKTGAHQRHGNYMTVPGLLGVLSTGRLAGLGAPCAQLVCAGMKDWSSPKDCFAKARAELEDSYAKADCSQLLRFAVEEKAGHEETPLMRSAIEDFLQEHLLGN